jgi:VWFA-related protein
MPTPMIRRTLLAAVLIAALVAPSLLRQAAAQQEAQQPLKVESTLVNLYATVRDKRHAIVADMKKEEFKVFEDGVEQKVEFFSRESELPLTMGILIDASGSVERLLGAEQATASGFLERVMRKSDEAMVMSFDLGADLVVDFTSEVPQLERGIRSVRINTEGGNARGGPMSTPGTFPTNGPIGTVFYDAVYLACREKLGPEAGRKAIIVLTDAEDNGSKKRMEDAIEAAQRSDAVIHILLQSDFRFMGGGGGIARRMTNETGGRTIDVRSAKDLEKAFDEISEELRSQYTIGYIPTNPAHDGKFRKIRVDSTRPDTKVLALQGYYASRR